jgi:type VI secretion system secreted protein VgrG
MKMPSTGIFVSLTAIVLGVGSPHKVRATPITLGTAGTFAVLAGATITNTGPTIINGGDVGVSPGSALTGFSSAVGTFATHLADGVALAAQHDLTTAYNLAASVPFTQDLTGHDLGGLVLLPGVYRFSSSAQLTGKLTLNSLGDPDAQFVFQIGSTLTTASNSSVVSLNGVGPLCDVFFQVGSLATLGTGTTFAGHILALTSITLNTGASIIGGSALALNGAVTLDTNLILNSPCGVVASVPEGGSAFAMVGAGFAGLVLWRRRCGFPPNNSPDYDSTRAGAK